MPTNDFYRDLQPGEVSRERSEWSHRRVDHFRAVTWPDLFRAVAQYIERITPPTGDRGLENVTAGMWTDGSPGASVTSAPPAAEKFPPLVTVESIRLYASPVSAGIDTDDDLPAIRVRRGPTRGGRPPRESDWLSVILPWSDDGEVPLWSQWLQVQTWQSADDQPATIEIQIPEDVRIDIALGAGDAGAEREILSTTIPDHVPTRRDIIYHLPLIKPKGDRWAVDITDLVQVVPVAGDLYRLLVRFKVHV